MNQEQIYDEKIAPLMAQIIDLCKEYRMPFVACFACPDGTEEGEDLRCTSYLLGDEQIGNQEGFAEAVRALKPTASTCAITIHRAV